MFIANLLYVDVLVYALFSVENITEHYSKNSTDRFLGKTSILLKVRQKRIICKSLVYSPTLH